MTYKQDLILLDQQDHKLLHLVFGGDLFPGPVRYTNTAFTFNGSSWTSVNSCYEHS
jgi:hypothetical protein